jgi:hypothetical protein
MSFISWNFNLTAASIQGRLQMDFVVEAALKKWPHVPDCYGWLGLSSRGDWYMRDEATQAQGTFSVAKGSRITHASLRDFIGRNYAQDATGCWYFQNGPQRVYVELETAPWVWRLELVQGSDTPQITSHTGLPAALQAAWTDEAGRLFLSTHLGLGLVHTLDMVLAANALEVAAWAPPQHSSFQTLILKHGYQLSPAAHQARSSKGPSA